VEQRDRQRRRPAADRDGVHPPQFGEDQPDGCPDDPEEDEEHREVAPVTSRMVPW
jgi:hypothetical protein